MIWIAWDNEKLGALSCTIDEKSRLRIDYDAATFNDDWSGDIELFYRSDDPRTILGIISTWQSKLSWVGRVSEAITEEDRYVRGALGVGLTWEEIALGRSASG